MSNQLLRVNMIINTAGWVAAMAIGDRFVLHPRR